MLKNFTLTFSFPYYSEKNFIKRGNFYKAICKNGELEIEIKPIITPETKNLMLPLLRECRETENEIIIPKQFINKLIDIVLEDIEKGDVEELKEETALPEFSMQKEEKVQSETDNFKVIDSENKQEEIKELPPLKIEEPKKEKKKINLDKVFELIDENNSFIDEFNTYEETTPNVGNKNIDENTENENPTVVEENKGEIQEVEVEIGKDENTKETENETKQVNKTEKDYSINNISEIITPKKGEIEISSKDEKELIDIVGNLTDIMDDAGIDINEFLTEDVKKNKTEEEVKEKENFFNENKNEEPKEVKSREKKYEPNMVESDLDPPKVSQNSNREGERKNNIERKIEMKRIELKKKKEKNSGSFFSFFKKLLGKII
jgi:hypothetical protein